MRLIMMSLPLLIMLSMTMSAARSDAGSRQQDPESKAVSEQSPFTVALLPASQTKAGAPQGLAGSAWRMESVRNIIGGGRESRLRFKQSADGTVRAIYESTWVHRSGDKPVVGDHGDTPCEVRGPILRWGDQQQTFAMVPGKSLALNVFVPLGDDRWYYTARQLFPSKNANGTDQPRWRDEEMMITFSADPLTHDSGTGTIQIRSGTPKVLKQEVRFTLERADRMGRLMTVSSKENRAVWARIFFPPEGKYGMRLDEPGISTLVYAPDTPSATAPATAKP